MFGGVKSSYSKIGLSLVSFLLLVQSVHSSWWYLGMAGSAYQSTLSSPKIPLQSKCSEIKVLAAHQQEMCIKSRNLLDVVSVGASMGIDECQHQFRDRRWNCSTFNTTDVFGKILQLRSREKAYIYSISTAGVMYAITRACAKGDVGVCGCDAKVRTTDTKGDFMWGGCSHNVQFGDQFTADFIDHNENPAKPDGLMNLWNNKAGRKGVVYTMHLVCKCHGVSGSCSAKICWRVMSTFRQIGQHMTERFDGASQVKFVVRDRTLLKPVDKRHKKPSKRDLVYLEESPDFCDYNPAHSSLGTRGRECNKTSHGVDGCNLMCCGRGYYTIVKELKEDCDCKFVWCCRVECLKCTRIVLKHYCN